MGNITAYIDLQEEIADIFASNFINIENILKSVPTQSKLQYGELLVLEDSESRSKDIVPIILASSAGLTAIILAISRILESVSRRPHIFEWDELEEVQENGKVVRNNRGQVVWKIKKKHVVLDPTQLKGDTILEFGAGVKGVNFKIKTTSK